MSSKRITSVISVSTGWQFVILSHTVVAAIIALISHSCSEKCSDGEQNSIIITTTVVWGDVRVSV